MKKFFALTIFIVMVCLFCMACIDFPEKPAEDEEYEEVFTEMYVTINENKLKIALENNSSVEALAEILKQGNIVYTAEDYGGFEKVGNIGHNLPTSDTQITTQSGDIMLYMGNQIVIFYGSNSWAYTKIGRINGLTESEIRSFLRAGNGDVQVTLSLT